MDDNQNLIKELNEEFPNKERVKELLSKPENKEALNNLGIKDLSPFLDASALKNALAVLNEETNHELNDLKKLESVLEYFVKKTPKEDTHTLSIMQQLLGKINEAIRKSRLEFKYNEPAVSPAINEVKIHVEEPKVGKYSPLTTPIPFNFRVDNINKYCYVVFFQKDSESDAVPYHYEEVERNTIEFNSNDFSLVSLKAKPLEDGKYRIIIAISKSLEEVKMNHFILEARIPIVIDNDQKEPEKKYQYNINIDYPVKNQEIINHPSTVVHFKFSTDYPHSFHYLINLGNDDANTEGDSDINIVEGLFPLAKKLKNGDSFITVTIANKKADLKKSGSRTVQALESTIPIKLIPPSAATSTPAPSAPRANPPPKTPPKRTGNSGKGGDESKTSSFNVGKPGYWST